METWDGGGPGQKGNVITAGKLNVYSFTATLQTAVALVNDPNGWQYKTTYGNGTLTLFNSPGAPWYNKKDTAKSWTYNNVTVINLSWNNLTDMAFDLSGVSAAGVPMFAGSYSGLINFITGPSGTYGDLDQASVKANK